MSSDPVRTEGPTTWAPKSIETGGNWCPVCGHGIPCDEDGCCGACGATCISESVLTEIRGWKPDLSACLAQARPGDGIMWRATNGKHHAATYRAPVGASDTHLWEETLHDGLMHPLTWTAEELARLVVAGGANWTYLRAQTEEE